MLAGQARAHNTRLHPQVWSSMRTVVSDKACGKLLLLKEVNRCFPPSHPKNCFAMFLFCTSTVACTLCERRWPRINSAPHHAHIHGVSAPGVGVSMGRVGGVASPYRAHPSIMAGRGTMVKDNGTNPQKKKGTAR